MVGPRERTRPTSFCTDIRSGGVLAPTGVMAIVVVLALILGVETIGLVKIIGFDCVPGEAVPATAVALLLDVVRVLDVEAEMFLGGVFELEDV
jgi:hypothetical protein